MFRSLFKLKRTILEMERLNKKVEELEEIINTKVCKNKLLEEITIQKKMK